MKFGMINAVEKRNYIEGYDTLKDAERALKLSNVDHGSIHRHLGFVIFQWALMTSPDMQHYFSIGKRLLGGNVVLYAVDDRGETVDFTQDMWPPICFYKDHFEVEKAIRAGAIIRPKSDHYGFEWGKTPHIVEFE